MSEISNPPCLRHYRGGHIECEHRAVFAVAQRGRLVQTAGRVEAMTFVRSGAKPFQALSVLARGVHRAHHLEDRHIAVIAASHTGDFEHQRAVTELLERGGLSLAHLRCGTHPPRAKVALKALADRGERPTALHNNCSGKHAGMLLAAQLAGESLEHYLDPEHPLQVANRRTLADHAGIPAEEVLVAIDGCSAPTFALRTDHMALALSRLGATGVAAYDQAAARLLAALATSPRLLGGEGRFDSDLIRATRGRWFAKVGADGFHGAWSLQLGYGIAVHADDGENRASELVLLGLIDALDPLREDELRALFAHWDPQRKNHVGRIVGHRELTAPVALTSR